MAELESEIAEWRDHLARGAAVDARDVEQLEEHLRRQIADLQSVGLAPDEAFLVAVKRVGGLAVVAGEHTGRPWKQLLVGGVDSGESARTDWRAPLAFAVAAAAAVQVARLSAGSSDEVPTWLLRNVSLLVLPFLAGFFAHRRRLPPRRWAWTAMPFVAAALLVNVYPFGPDSDTEVLVAAHLPVLLGAVVAYPYSGGDARSHARRMDFVRFAGEWVVYYALIALGGSVLTTLTVAVIEPTGAVDPDHIVEWVLPSGAAGAVIVAAWLVEWKQRLVENLAPVLAALFTPMFAVMMVVAAGIYAVTGWGDAFDRELLGVFDALLVVVSGLVLYGTSAREPLRPPGWMDRIRLVAVVSALALDAMVLATMLARIDDLGFTPNRTAALGLNLVLLVNLAGSAVLGTRFLTGRGTHRRLERWQTGYLPVLAGWLVVVVAVLPPLFDFA